MSATANDLQVSTTESKVAFATAVDDEYKLADGRVGVRYAFADAFTGSFSSAQLCCAYGTDSSMSKILSRYPSDCVSWQMNCINVCRAASFFYITLVLIICRLQH